MKTKNYLMLLSIIFLAFFFCDKDDSSGPDNVAPIMSTIENQVIAAGTTNQVSISAIDADGDKLSFSIPQNPGFLSVKNVSQPGDTATATLELAPNVNNVGTFTASVQVSDGKDSDATAFTIEVQEAKTKLYLRTNGQNYLSEQQTPPPTSVQFFFYSYTEHEWKAILSNGISGTNYTFSLWLAADYPQGTFDISLLVDHNGSETELASTSITVPSNQYYQEFTKTVTGQSGGTAGDELILRMSYGGSYRGGLLFGSSQSSDSHILIPGNISVSEPLMASQPNVSNEALTSSAQFDEGKGSFTYSESHNK